LEAFDDALEVAFGAAKSVTARAKMRAMDFFMIS
jgi:hypothetical protein